MKVIAVFLLGLICPLSAFSVEFSPEQAAVIPSFGPWQNQPRVDDSNRFSGDRQAIELGRQLFFDRRLSKGNVLACADCHQPDQQFADTVALNRGWQPLSRHTTSLININKQHWFGWGGENDSLWAQSIRPIVSYEEMNISPAELKATLTSDDLFQCQAAQLTKQSINSLSDEDFLVFIGKVLASFQETIVSEETRVDQFVASFSESKGDQFLTASEQRGLAIFAGEGRCFFCHSGPNFSNGEFADIGVPFFTESGVDKGRYGGIESVLDNNFNRLGTFNDGNVGANSTRTQYVQLLPRNWGEFKVPPLRNVADTAPYMHNGSLATLDDVIDFYSNFNEERVHVDGERILRPLNLSDQQKADLKSFLSALSAPITFAQANTSAFDCN